VSPTRRLWLRLAAVGCALGALTAVVGVLVARADEPTVEAAVSPASGGGDVPPFDPALPLDLSRVRGVTPAQAAAAEELVAAVAAAAPELASYDDAVAAGYASAGDAFTGVEHLVRWSLLDDGVDLDPTQPEGLVYEVADDGERTLVAMMFLRPPGARSDDAPRPGGPLTRWHEHGDLCVRPGPAPAVAGLTDAGGRCDAGLEPLRPMPGLHVWVVRHRCGPFAELEGPGVRLDPDAPGCRHEHG
jgi:hypothetical protein